MILSKRSSSLQLIVMVLLLLVLAYAAEDYYKIMGVPRNADQQTIKKAFKKLSLKYHPDKNKNRKEWAQEQYVKVANAYETLSDPEKRRTYDAQGEEGVRRQEQGGGYPGEGFPGGGFPGGFGGGFHGGFHGRRGGFQGASFDDIFGSFFGGGGRGREDGFHGSGRHQQPQQEDFWAQSDVIELTLGGITAFYRREQVWIILFYKSNQRVMRDYKDPWRETAEKLYGIIKVAAVNCDEDKEEALCEDFGITQTPVVYVYTASISAEGIKYTGKMNYASISEFATSKMESFVRLVTDDNYQEFLQDSSSSRAKVLLFTSRKTTPPLLKALSKDYKGRLDFGEVRQSSKTLISKFKVQNFPTVMVVTDALAFRGVSFEGEFKRDPIANFLREYAYSNKQAAPSAGNGQLAELTERMIKEGRCGDADDKLCFLYIAKSRRDEYGVIEPIANFAPKYEKDPINFYIIDARRISFVTSFGAETKVPVVVILKGKKQRYVKFDGDFNEKQIRGFVDTVVSGSATFQKLKQAIRWTTNTEEL